MLASALPCANCNCTDPCLICSETFAEGDAILLSASFDSGTAGTTDGEGHDDAGYETTTGSGASQTLTFQHGGSLSGGELAVTVSGASGYTRWTPAAAVANSLFLHVYANRVTGNAAFDITFYTSASLVSGSSIRFECDWNGETTKLFVDGSQTDSLSEFTDGDASVYFQLVGTAVRAKWGSGTTVSETLAAAREIHAVEVKVYDRGSSGATTYQFDNLFVSTKLPTGTSTWPISGAGTGLALAGCPVASVTGDDPITNSGVLELEAGDGVAFSSEAAAEGDAVRVRFTIDTASTNGTIRAILAWSDWSNYLYGDAVKTGSDWELLVGRRLAGTDTDYTEAVAITAPTLPTEVCLSWHPGETQTPESFITTPLNGTETEHSGWTNPDNILTDNGSEASYNFSGVGVSDGINIFGFPLALPPGSTVDGIDVSVEARRNPSIGTALQFHTVKLMGDWDYNSGSSDNLAASTSIAGSATVYGFGGSTNTWGITDLSWEHLNYQNFGIQIKLELTTGPTGGQGLIDYVELTVYFTTPERTPGVLRLVIDGEYVTAYSAENPAGGLKAAVRSQSGDWDVDNLFYEYAQSDSRPSCSDCTIVDDVGPCSHVGAPTVDFGAGGWTDDECTNCDQILGEYELTTPATYSLACGYYYNVPGDCGLFIQALLFESVTECYWDVRLLKFSVSAISSVVAYRQTPIGAGGCTGDTFTLNKYYEEHDPTDPVCGGTMPATITIEVP